MTHVACIVACIVFLLDGAGLHGPVPPARAIRYHQLGCVRIQIMETSTESGANSKEVHCLTERAVRGWEESGLLRPSGSVTSLGPDASHLSVLLSSDSVQDQYVFVEVLKVTSRHFQCPELPFIISVIKSGEIFFRRIPSCSHMQLSRIGSHGPCWVAHWLRV